MSMYVILQQTESSRLHVLLKQFDRQYNVYEYSQQIRHNIILQLDNAKYTKYECYYYTGGNIGTTIIFSSVYV